MRNRIVCRAAGVVAFIVWPIVATAGIVALIIGSVFFTDWLNRAIHTDLPVGKWVLLTITGLMLLGFFVAQGMTAYEWVQNRCSSDNGRAEP